MPTTQSSTTTESTPSLREQADAAKQRMSEITPEIERITAERDAAKGAAKTKLSKQLAKLEKERAEIEPTAKLFDTRSGRKRPAASIAPTEGEQVCRTCEEEKPLNQFPTIAPTKRGTECRACQKERRGKAAEREAAIAPKPAARKRTAKPKAADQAGAAGTPEPASTPATAA
ncbi:host-nuclease inhibitor Gam family protein [Solirubrobacter taibaiensis]|nr:host-nuclease inhibitor Gam family protein [Solirubrobacter taibaiensis]